MSISSFYEYKHNSPATIRQRVVSWLLAALLLAGIIHGQVVSTASATTVPCNVAGIAMYAWHHDADDIDWDFDGQWPDDEDWIAFINQGSTAVDISGWRLYTELIGHYHTFPSGTVLDPGERIYVMSNYTGTVPDGWQDASQTNSQGWSDASAAATWLVNPTSGQFAVFYTDNSLPGNPSNFPGTNRVCSYSMQGSGLGQDDLNECQVLLLNTATGTYSIVHVCPGTDLDGDGVRDVADLCPNISAATKSGCSTAPPLPPAPPAPVCSDVAIYSGNDSGNFLRTWTSNGNGSFQLTPVSTTGFFRTGTGTQVFGTDVFQFTTYADATGDGLSDLIHVTEDNHSIFVYPNNGGGTFQTTPISTTGIQGGTSNGFAGVTSDEQSWLADTNADGRIDYIFSGGDNRVHVYLGNGNGTFSTTRITSLLTDPVGYKTSGRSLGEYFMMGDVTGDRVADLVGTGDSAGTGRIYIWRGNGDGTFQANVYFNALLQQSNGVSSSSGVGDEEYSQLADADGDGDLDYVHATGKSGHKQILVFKNNGDGTFGPIGGDGRIVAQSTTGFVAPGNNHIYFADININEHSFFQDVNGDGTADYIWTGSTPVQSGFFVWLNNGTGSFSTSFIHSNVSNRLTGETSGITMGIGCVATLDTDGDGVPNGTDLDSDNDGILDTVEGTADTDGDGIPNRLDLDSDNDGINDVIETGGTDANGDGRADGTPDGNGRPVPGGLTAVDTDGDGIPNYRDLDSDNDSVSDLFENGYGGYDTNNDGFLSTADSGVTDTDGDGIMSVVDGSQSWGDANDLAPLNTDADSTPNYIDTDSDGDNILDIDEVGKGDLDTNNDGRIDNSSDADLDGIADSADNDDARFGGLPAPILPLGEFLACTTDIVTPGTNGGTFGSGAAAFGPALSSAQTSYPYRAGSSLGGTYALIKNTDSVDFSVKVFNSLQERTDPGNGYFAYFDLGIPDRGRPIFTDTFALPPNVQHEFSFWWAGPFIGTADSVGRLGIRINGVVVGTLTITDNTVWQNYTFTFTSNSSGVTIVELINNSTGGGSGSDVALDDFKITTFCDYDGDGVLNANDLDNDGDGISDAIENSVGGGDSDGDGIPNRFDLDSDNDGINDVIEAGGLTDANNDGKADGPDANNDGIIDNPATAPMDSDRDGTPDHTDLDSDNDGISDQTEGNADTDNDGLPNRLEPNNRDTDGDGNFDHNDANDDNDAIPTRDEGGADGIVNDDDADGDGIPDHLDSSNGTGGGSGDSDGDGIDDATECPTGNPCADSDNDGTPDYQDEDSDDDGFTDEDENNNGTDPTDPNSIPGVAVSAKVLLQGALINPNNPSTPLSVMRDDIRSRNLLPLTSPYTGTAVVTATTALFAANGNDSVVDWVQLELRNAATPTTIVATLAALVQRDGDVIDATGSTTLVFRGVPTGSYFVAVTHRNHLGTMTAAPVSLSGTATLVDFTNTAADFFNAVANLNGFEQATIGGKFALWTGDANGDGRVAFSGQNNDVDAIFTAIDQAPGNLLGVPTFILNGYLGTDVDLTGSTIFSGEDVNTIFNTIDGHPRNLFGLPTYVIAEQLP